MANREVLKNKMQSDSRMVSFAGSVLRLEGDTQPAYLISQAGGVTRFFYTFCAQINSSMILNFPTWVGLLFQNSKEQTLRQFGIVVIVTSFAPK